MNNRLIGVTGYKNSGKNAVCDVLHEHFGYTITGFADILKSMAYDINPIVAIDEDGFVRLQEVVDAMGWDAAKELVPEVRRFLQYLGTEGGRKHLGLDVWVDAWQRSIIPMLELSDDKVCVSDMRFLNESYAVKELGGECWRVIRPGFTRGTHDSEIEQDLIEVELVFRNDRTLGDLEHDVRIAMETFS